MPLTRIYQPDALLTIGFWELSEDSTQLLSWVELSEEERIWVETCHPNRQNEILGVRVLLKNMLKSAYQGISYDELGKPALIGNTQSLSISHSQNQIVVALHPSKNIGIDLEFFSERINRLQQKFMSAKELAFCGENLVKKTLLWSAKESLYKWYGKKKLDFRQHISISDFELSKYGNFQGQIHKGSLCSALNVRYLVLENRVLTFVVE